MILACQLLPTLMLTRRNVSEIFQYLSL
jgi:hypothetical protein